MDKTKEKSLEGRITAGILTKGPLKNSRTVDTKTKVKLGNNKSYQLLSIHAHLSLGKEMDIFQQPHPGTSSLQSSWSHFEENNNTTAVPFQTLKETLMAQKPWSRGFIFNGDLNYHKEHNDTKAMQSPKNEILENADPADPTTSGKGSENQNQTTIKSDTKGKDVFLGDMDYLNKNASSVARTNTTSRSTKTVMEIVNRAMSEYDKMTGVRSIGHVALKTKALSAARIIMASQPAGKINMETFNSTMYMCEYDRMTGVIYGGHAPPGQGWSIGQVAIGVEGRTTTSITGETSTPRITSRMSLDSPPQANTLNQITSTLSNYALPLPLVLPTSPDPNNHDIPVSQNPGMDNPHGFEKIDEGTHCININDFSFLKTPNPEKHEIELQAANVSAPKPAAVINSEYDVCYLKTEVPPPESPENSPQKTDHSQPKDRQCTHPLHEARVIQQTTAPALSLETSQAKRRHKKQRPHPNNPKPNHNRTRKNQGKALDPDELDWLIAYNRANIPASGMLSQKYWKKAAEEFEEEFNNRQSPTSLAKRFSGGDIAARIRARRSQANRVVPFTGKRPWSYLENAWFTETVGNKKRSEIDFVELGKAFQYIYGIERSVEEWEVKWDSEKR